MMRTRKFNGKVYIIYFKGNKTTASQTVKELRANGISARLTYDKEYTGGQTSGWVVWTKK